MFYITNVLDVVYDCIGQTHIVVKDAFTHEVIIDDQIKNLDVDFDENTGATDKLLEGKKVATIRVEDNKLIIHAV